MLLSENPFQCLFKNFNLIFVGLLCDSRKKQATAIEHNTAEEFQTPNSKKRRTRFALQRIRPHSCGAECQGLLRFASIFELFQNRDTDSIQIYSKQKLLRLLLCGFTRNQSKSRKKRHRNVPPNDSSSSKVDIFCRSCSSRSKKSK